MERGVAQALTDPPDAVIRTLVGAHGCTVELIKIVARGMEAMQLSHQTALENITMQLLKNNSQEDKQRRPLSENKCFANLKTLGADRAVFKSWNDKFINAICQVRGKVVRDFMQTIIEMLEVTRKPVAKQDYQQKA